MQYLVGRKRIIFGGFPIEEEIEGWVNSGCIRGGRNNMRWHYTTYAEK
jgi:hypothetical protein